MADIQSTYSLTLKDGLYFKLDGTPFKANGCNIVKSKLEKGGYKAVLVSVDGGYAMRIMDIGKTDGTATSGAERPIEQDGGEKPIEGEMTLEELRKEVADLEEKKKLEERLAELKGQKTPDNGNGTEPVLSRGSSPSGRPRRKPVVETSLLSFPEVPGYTRRLVNDVNGGMRVNKLLGEDWEIDPDQNARTASDGDLVHIAEDGTAFDKPSQMGSVVSRPVGTDKEGRPLRAVLMRKRKDWYDEDQAAKQALEDRKIASLQVAPKGLRPVDRENPYPLQIEGFEPEADRRI